MIPHPQTRSELPPVVLRLEGATNEHDLDGIVACFTPDYRSDIPLHPSRSFRGAAQVHRNWSQILGAVPDLRAELIRFAVNGGDVWAEWEWRGTRRDGVPHLMRGTTILGIESDSIDWARFYMEPVVDDGVAIDAAVVAAVDPEPGQ